LVRFLDGLLARFASVMDEHGSLRILQDEVRLLGEDACEGGVGSVEGGRQTKAHSFPLPHSAFRLEWTLEPDGTAAAWGTAAKRLLEVDSTPTGVSEFLEFSGNLFHCLDVLLSFGLTLL